MRAWASLDKQNRKLVEKMMTRIKENGLTPGMRPHRISSQESILLSLSPNMDLRVLGWETKNNLILLHVDHHDKAYEWAHRNNNKIIAAETIAFGGDIQTTTSREQQEATSVYGEQVASELSKAGVPTLFSRLLKDVTSEKDLLDCLEFVAPEWQELILDAVTNSSKMKVPKTFSNILIAPDDDILKAALSLPLSQWRIFLHPVQNEAANLDISEDLAIIGGPGTGKTVCLIHRAHNLASSCNKDECVVLVGHSPSAVEAMNTMLKQLPGGIPTSLHVVNMIAIGRRGKPQSDDVFGPRGQSNGYLQHMGENVVALLIDEAQDIHRTTKGFIFGRRTEIKTHVTIALDFNQNLFADNRCTTQYLSFLKRARKIHLKYSYRIPKESGLTAKLLVSNRQFEQEEEIVSELRELSTIMKFGFSVDFQSVEVHHDVESAIAAASHKYYELREVYRNDVGIIFCGNSNDRQLHATQLQELGYDTSTEKGLLTPRGAKGQEFEYCLVIGPELLMREDINPYMAVNAVYVALSRCRRGFTVYTNSKFATMLSHPQQSAISGT